MVMSDSSEPRLTTADLRLVTGAARLLFVGGKGGVGKTTVAVNLALALAKSGSKVGMIDGDIYGPNVPIMLGTSQEPLATADWMSTMLKL